MSIGGFRALIERERAHRTYEVMVADNERRERDEARHEEGRRAYEAIVARHDEQDLEAARCELAWLIGEWADFVHEHHADARPMALAKVIAHLAGTEVFDPTAKLIERPSDELLAVARVNWPALALGRTRPPLVWSMQVLHRSGLSIMTDGQEASHAQMPALVPLWRGFTSNFDETDENVRKFAAGHSWTTSYDAALRYAWQENPAVRSHLARAFAPREAIYAHFPEAYLQEAIVLHPDLLGEIEVQMLEKIPARPAMAG